MSHIFGVPINESLWTLFIATATALAGWGGLIIVGDADRNKSRSKK